MPDDVPPISSARLELVSLSLDAVEALLEGRRDEALRLIGAAPPEWWPSEDILPLLRMRAGQMRTDPASRPWLVRAIVLPGGSMIGHAGFHGPPGVNAAERPDAVELGYAIFPPFRGSGYATEAAGALMDWAREQDGVRAFVASVSPGNAPSLAVVRKLGFVRTGEHWDEEDGLELVFERQV